MVQKNPGLFLFLFLFVLVILGCDNSSSSFPNQNKLYVVTTTGMIRDAVQNVAGEYVILDSLMGAGIDPHLYKVTANDANKLSRANIIFYNGLHLEGKMTEILEKIGRNKPVHSIAQKIAIERLRKTSEDSNLLDPHIWFDVSLWQNAVQTIEEVLCQHDPKNQEVYRKNSLAYQEKLNTLDRWVKEQIASIPQKRRVLITAHDAFGYFGRAYQIEVVGLQGISTTAEYGVKDVERITDLIVQRKIPAIFVETSVSPKAITAVIHGASTRNHVIQLGGSLFSDSMGENNTLEGTYIGMVEYNVKLIVSALR